MTVEPAKSTEPVKAGTPRKRRGALYLFCVIAVATFLIFLALGRGQNSRFKATAVLLATTTQPTEPLPSLDAVREEITSPSLIREAVDQLVAADAIAGAELTSAEVRYNLDIKQHTESTAEQVGIAVSYTGRDANAAVAAVNQICDVFVRQKSKANSPSEAPAYRDDYAAAEQAAQDAERDYQEARRRLIDFDGQHGDVLNPPVPQQTDAAAADPPQAEMSPPAESPLADSPSSDSPRSDSPRSDSPQSDTPRQSTSAADLAEAEREVTELEAKVEQKTTELAELLKTMTPSHPTVTDANLRLAQAESELAAARIKVDVRREFQQGFDDELQNAADPNADDPNAVDPNLAESRGNDFDTIAETGPEIAPPEIDPEERESLLAERQSLEDAVREAERKRDLAKQEEHQQWQRRFDSRPALVWDVDHATATERNYVPTERSLLLFAALFGLLSGGGFLIAGSNPATINSESSAESVLSAPVVGVVPAPPGHAPPSHQLSFVLRLIVLAAETALFVFLLAMIVVALLDKPFADQMLADPLSALVDGIGQLLRMLWR